MSKTEPAPAVRTALVVDDDPEMRSIVKAYLAELGIACAEAENGVSALAHARRDVPDVILLDIEMPVMNGSETLTWLKGDPALRDIPVIVVSGAGETKVAVRCIEAGAEDYLPKPVDPALLRARVRSCLERARLRAAEKAYQRRLEAYEVELEERVRVKTRDLAAAHERLGILDQAKSEFLQLISHELRTPMTGAVFASEALAVVPAGERDDDQWTGAVQLLRDCVVRLARIVEDALLLTSIKVSPDAFALAPRALRPIVADAARRAGPLAAARGLEIVLSVADDIRVFCDERLLTDALTALFECALKFSAPAEALRVDCLPLHGVAQLAIRVCGSSIPAAMVPRFFEILALGADPLTPGGDLGLGPPVAAQIMRLLGGSVAVESVEAGVSFVVTLRRE